MPPFTGTGLPLFSERARGRGRGGGRGGGGGAAGKRSGRGRGAPQGFYDRLTWSDVMSSPHCDSTEEPDDVAVTSEIFSAKILVSMFRGGAGLTAGVINGDTDPMTIPDKPVVGADIPGSVWGNVELAYAGAQPILKIPTTRACLKHCRFPLSRATVTARASALHEKAHGRPMTDAEKEHMWSIYRRYVFMGLEDNKVFKAPPQPAAAMTPAQGAFLHKLVVRPTPLADPVLWFVREKVRARIPSALWPEPMPWYPPVSKKEASRLIDALK